jgi:FtsH-binding integral membrane protein
VQSKLKDNGRIWLWGFLAVMALAQLYVVRELLAAFALFALGFAALAFVVASLYMLQKSWELAVARLAALRHPVISIASVANLASAGNLANISRDNQKAA